MAGNYIGLRGRAEKAQSSRKYRKTAGHGGGQWRTPEDGRGQRKTPEDNTGQQRTTEDYGG